MSTLRNIPLHWNRVTGSSGGGGGKPPFLVTATILIALLIVTIMVLLSQPLWAFAAVLLALTPVLVIAWVASARHRR